MLQVRWRSRTFANVRLLMLTPRVVRFRVWNKLLPRGAVKTARGSDTPAVNPPALERSLTRRVGCITLGPWANSGNVIRVA